MRPQRIFQLLKIKFPPRHVGHEGCFRFYVPMCLEEGLLDLRRSVLVLRDLPASVQFFHYQIKAVLLGQRIVHDDLCWEHLAPDVLSTVSSLASACVEPPCPLREGASRSYGQKPPTSCSTVRFMNRGTEKSIDIGGTSSTLCSSMRSGKRCCGSCWKHLIDILLHPRHC